MATFFVNPYTMYYEKLNSATAMVGNSKTFLQDAENVLSILKRLQTHISSSSWKELGSSELATTSIPALISRVEMLNTNISSGLVVACDKSINTLLPDLIKLKEKDVEYEAKKKELEDCINSEPSNKYVVKKGKTTSEYTSEYASYLEKRARLEKEVNDLETEIKELIAKIDATVSEITALNGSSSKFGAVSTGGISEVEGATLTETEAALVDVLNNVVTEYSTEAGLTYDQSLDTLAGVTSTGKTVLYNDVGTYESGLGYNRQILTSHGKMVNVFQQAWCKNTSQFKYNDIENDPKSLRSSGCGYNALASIMSSKYPNITPEQLFLEMGRKSLYASNIKTHLESNYGIKVGYRDDFSGDADKKNKIIQEVMKGNMVICTVDGRTDYKYTKQGHWVSIVDYDPKTDEFYVTDSNDQDSSNAPPIDATRFLRDYEINSNIIYIADDSGYREKVNA